MVRMKRQAWSFAVLALAAAAAAQGVPARAETPAVRVAVAGRAPLVLDRAALAALPRAGVSAAVHGEAPGRWQGVALEDLLQRAGAPAGRQLRGRALASFVRVSAADGYQVVFGLGELDPGLGHAQAILADARDGQPLGTDGPFRLVVPGDRRAARWVRNVTAIEVVDGAAPAGH